MKGVVVKIKRDTLPTILMLIAAGITSIITFVQDYSMVDKLFSLLLTILIFYFLGNIIKWTLNYFDRQNEAKIRAEEEKAEKEKAEKEKAEALMEET